MQTILVAAASEILLERLPGDLLVLVSGYHDAVDSVVSSPILLTEVEELLANHHTINIIHPNLALPDKGWWKHQTYHEGWCVDDRYSDDEFQVFKHETVNIHPDGQRMTEGSRWRCMPIINIEPGMTWFVDVKTISLVFNQRFQRAGFPGGDEHNKRILTALDGITEHLRTIPGILRVYLETSIKALNLLFPSITTTNNDNARCVKYLRVIREHCV